METMKEIQLETELKEQKRVNDVLLTSHNLLINNILDQNEIGKSGEQYDIEINTHMAVNRVEELRKEIVFQKVLSVVFVTMMLLVLLYFVFK